MRCPRCGENTPDEFWRTLVVECPDMAKAAAQNVHPEDLTKTDLGARDNHWVSLDWMYCAAKGCGQLVVRLHDWTNHRRRGFPERDITSRFVYPALAGTRPIDELVPDNYRRDYTEAAAILDTSPRMSAVLSRRILADLLEDYAKLDQFRLVDRIDKFIADRSRPHDIRENLHYLREIADLSAHTKKNDQAQIIEISPEEAAWTLDVIDRLFDHFIVTPGRDKSLRDSIDQKLADAGRPSE